MLRATSEMAAAISVTSAPLKPSSSASVRPRWRAVTMSTAEWISVWSSASIDGRPLHFSLEVGQALFEIQRGTHALGVEAQLDHREGDIRLDPDDDGFGPPQFQHVRDRPQR